WLDAHNATAVFALPFHIMITFSGLLLLLFTIMPWGVNQIYENRGAFLQDQRKTLIQDNGQEAESRAGRSERGGEVAGRGEG
ncbi:PepSY-associated TM helix domain-containing protein, partial [Acinetobacter nosocomialis]|uniref:PepSY-associated TM helix domain-containing protein n=2 Tax=Moraxellaceae TaxID=468 RepID=UPI0030F8FAA4